MRKCECKECGEAFETQRNQALFCSDTCRLKFNRRRRDRGAELYDFIMVHGNAATVKRLVEAYRTSDKVLRAGRPSWQDTQMAIVNLPAVFGNSGDKR